MPRSKPTVLVALSGGVDSSTALYLLREQGYTVVGVTMKLWQHDFTGSGADREATCCSPEAFHNAKLLCQQLDVPHYTLDYHQTFRRLVVDNFVDEYRRGRTPNPCVRCNAFLKWGTLLEQARRLGADRIATGHYARLTGRGSRLRLRKGRDPHKEQSYFLWAIDRADLARTLFPLGELTKAEVRALAVRAGLPTAAEPESQEVCFIPDNDYRRFLEAYTGGELGRRTGYFVKPDGTRLTPHRGIAAYTIGQRRGLGVAGPKPYYVSRIDPASGDVTITTRAGLYFSGCAVTDVNRLTDDDLTTLPEITVQIRYNHPGVTATVAVLDSETLALYFREPQFAVAPGQSAVFYRGDVVLGGGIIKEGWQ